MGIVNVKNEPRENEGDVQTGLTASTLKFGRLIFD